MLTLRIIVLFALGANLAGRDEVTVSPKGSLQIVQHYGQEGWSETLYINGKASRDIVLEYSISWPGDYYTRGHF